jgi:hypothetical protein
VKVVGGIEKVLFMENGITPEIQQAQLNFCDESGNDEELK